MTIEKASSLLDKADIKARVIWYHDVSFNGDYEDIYELTEQPRWGQVMFWQQGGGYANYAFDQMEQKIKIIEEPTDMGIQYLVAMRTMAQEVAER